MNEKPETTQQTVYIPQTDYNIEEGWHVVVTLLRKYKSNPNAVQYIADMLEI